MPWVDWWPRDHEGVQRRRRRLGRPEPRHRRDVPQTPRRRRLGGHATRAARPAAGRGTGLPGGHGLGGRRPVRVSRRHHAGVVGYGSETSEEHDYGARWLADVLPNAACEEIDGTGHFAPNTHPEAFAAFVVSGRPPRPPAPLSSGVCPTPHPTPHRTPHRTGHPSGSRHWSRPKSSSSPGVSATGSTNTALLRTAA